MVNRSEKFGGEKIWIPEVVKGSLTKALAREPIDLTSPEVLGKNFVNKKELEDVYDVIGKVRDPILIGLHGSRASLQRPPLFENLREFDLYYSRKAELSGTITKYLEENEFSFHDYQKARELLERGFNDGYRHGIKYPEPLVRLLVRDINLLIICGGNHIRGGNRVGKRTHVDLDIGVNSPFFQFASDFEDLETYLQLGLDKTIPVRY